MESTLAAIAKHLAFWLGCFVLCYNNNMKAPPPEKMLSNVPLSRMSTIGIGGVARFLINARGQKDIEHAMAWCRSEHVPFYIMGAGTNILFAEDLFDGLIVVMKNTSVKFRGEEVIAGSGIDMQKLLDKCFANNLQGLEWAGGLPGTLGGALYGNAGAFGGQMQDHTISIASVDVSRDGIKTRSRGIKECRFGYRTSVFKRLARRGVRSIITHATLCLNKTGAIAPVRTKAAHVLLYRKEHHPLYEKTLGSTFTNIPLTAATPRVRALFKPHIKNDPFPLIPVAAVLDVMGMKGCERGGARFSQKHPNFIVNHGGASFDDVRSLINHAKKKARDIYGITLEEEIRTVTPKQLFNPWSTARRRRAQSGNNK
jgi:UDP-N-acetylmuramate dehydrogenase